MLFFFRNCWMARSFSSYIFPREMLAGAGEFLLNVPCRGLKLFLYEYLFSFGTSSFLSSFLVLGRLTAAPTDCLGPMRLRPFFLISPLP